MDDTTRLFTRSPLKPKPGDDKSVGRYKLGERIGQGAMATVYRAHDPKIDRRIAIKLLNPSYCQHEEHRSRFVRESKGAGLLSHPNIVTVFDVGEDGNQPYIAMELVEGQTLEDWLKQNKSPPVAAVVAIGVQLADALAYAHKRGIVHRDIKPGNIMLVGTSTVIKVTDFGICRIDDNDGERTRIGDVLGTPHYMSPEQVMGQVVDARSDLFATGVLLYQMLTGGLPFKADTMIGVGLKIVRADPEPIDQRRPDLPLRLRRIVERCLRKEPEKRYQGGEELARDLQLVARELAESTDEAKPKGWSLGVRWAAIGGGLVLLTMLVATFFIQHHQNAAMMRQVASYGGSLAKAMATYGAQTVLDGLPDPTDPQAREGAEYAALEPLIQRAMSGQGFRYLQFVGTDGVVIGSSVADQVNKPYAPPAGTVVETDETDLAVKRQIESDGQAVLDFATPVTYSTKGLGTVHLGIAEAPLTSVAHLTLSLLLSLIVLTTIVVGIITYMLARRVAGPIRVLRNSLVELGRGHYDYRIKDQRNDEFGDLYVAFDAAAQDIQQRHERPAKSPST